MPSVVTTIPLLQYKPGDLGLVPATKPSISPTMLQKVGKVSVPAFFYITINILFTRYQQNLQLNYLQ